MPGLHHYAFRTTWRFTRPRDAVFAVLRDVPTYPQWWPQVRSAHEVEPGRGEMLIRSALPYDLRIQLRQRILDPGAGRLVAQLSGDLRGWSGWTVSEDGEATEVVFEEHVEAVKPTLRRLAFVARPAFIANHAVMMRAGELGLRAYLAGR